jgi:cation-transporting ATPase 13A1
MAHSSPRYQYFCLTVIPLLLLSQILLFFASRWSILVSFYIGYRRVSTIDTADHVLAFSSKSNGGKIVKLCRRSPSDLQDITIAGKKFVYSCEYFEFDKVKYEYDTTSSSFVRLSSPTQISVAQVVKARGHPSESVVSFCISKWGFNFFDIPIPLFLDLYVEHICAPFFVFQVLCLFLWSMDDYWYYSMFTLMMLLVFEGMLCKQRQNSLFMLRNMRRPPQQVLVLRCGQWCQISSDELVPGDVVILSSEGHGPSGPTEAVVPCDGVLLSGSCVVNEAMLTGESVPQVKEALINDVTVGPTLDIGSEFNSEAGAIWKSHVLLGGTTMLQHSISSPSGGTLEKLPISGCKVLVLRTGFGTTQVTLSPTLERRI